VSEKYLGLVLCGGESRRMGVDKWDLRIYGKTWAEYSRDLLAPFCEKVYFSAGTELVIPNAEFVIDALPGEGPLTGWVSFQKRFPGRSLLTLPVDMPLLTSDDVAALPGDDSGYLSGPEEKAPLAACLRAEDLEKLCQHFDKGLRSAFEFWEKTPHRIRQIASDRPLVNFNSPQDMPKSSQNRLGRR
jgi:molybdopterin-guanine dinucleotide biosynthesis protein A